MEYDNNAPELPFFTAFSQLLERFGMSHYEFFVKLMLFPGQLPFPRLAWYFP
ncbi:Uncharacterised protein [Yersinia pseudotuberculosis]|uniref:Uncharacterized protein n=1 Tax=Yersinia pseudotuberculosis TaxID=633 RepID=A0A380QAD7_YERPU|nr:Uncharacterised protein [Yersinia pseudotuberculosis]SUP82953.1 Uncharacterised protein [Yersinia pseudotuberculosis]